MSDEGQTVNLAAVRELLLAAFKAKELRRFCQERPAFEPILANLGPGYNLNQVVDELIDHCQKNLRFDQLLAEVQAMNPRQYARFEAELGLPAVTLDEVACPYRGLEPFEAEHAEFYFGREAMVQQLLERFEERAGEQGLVAVVGSSGCGKSSLVRAGLVTALHQGALPGSRYWVVRTFRPGTDPLWALSVPLVELLEPEVSEVERLADARKLARHLGEGTVPMADVAARLGETELIPHLVLIVDQFEELYTECADEATRKVFVDTLLAAAAAGDITVVLTLRADFYGRVLDDRRLGEAVDAGLVNVLPMSEEELQAVVEQPALRTGRTFEPGLVERIVNDVAGEPGNLPLLEFALTQLWGRQTAQGLLTHEAYETIGEVERAIARRAEAEYNELEKQGHAEVVQRIFVRLAHHGGGGLGTRRQAALADLVTPRTPREAVEPVVRALADARLLVTGGVTAETATAEVSHEALIRGWGRLQGWLDDDQAFGLWQQKLAGALRTWQETGEDKGSLLRGARLSEAERWLAERGEELNEAERAFIERGLALRDQEEANRRQQQRQEAELEAQRQSASRLRQLAERRRQLAIGLGVAVVIGILLALLATVQWNRATHEVVLRRTGEAEAILARDAASTSEADAILARDAASTSEAAAITAEAAALEARDLLATQAAARTTAEAEALRQRDEADQARGTAEAALATAHAEATARAVAQAEADEQRALAEAVSLIARSRELAAQAMARVGDGTDLALLLSLEALNVADTVEARSALIAALQAYGPLYRDLGRHPSTAMSVAFRPDGQMLASAGCDEDQNIYNCRQGEIRLWDLSGNETRSRPLRGHSDTVSSVAFNPQDGQMLASGSWDATVVLWDVATGEPLGEPLTGHRSKVVGVAFSPDGRTLASAGETGTILLWDMATGTQLHELGPWQGGMLTALAHSPDGQLLAAGTSRGTIMLHDVRAEKGLPFLDFPGIRGDVLSLAFSPDSRILVAGAGDGTVTLWDVATALDTEAAVVPLLVPPLTDHTSRVTSVDVSPDGQTVASGSCGVYSEEGYCVLGEVRLWDLATGKLAGEPLLGTGEPDTGFGNRVQSLAFGPDGRTLAVGHTDGVLLLWTVGVEAWSERACELVTRNLTEAEWQQYQLDGEPRQTCP